MSKNLDSKSFVNEFNFRIGQQLLTAGYSKDDILCLGVSGGADSICLLTSLVEFLQNYFSFENSTEKINLKVLTINHNIRPEEESLADCIFVKDFCKSLTLSKKYNHIKIECKIISLKKGHVFELAKNRGRGIEDAARFLRYNAFEQFCQKVFESKNNSKQIQLKKIFFATAHNQNDQLETLIMRFLQGAQIKSRCGILETKTVILKNKKTLKYIKPLLEIPREQIEKYLKIKNIEWRTDFTNKDNSYLRNRIRNLVIPLFDKNFDGWKKSVLTGRQKAIFENDFINNSLDKKNNKELCWQFESNLDNKKDSVFIDKKLFFESELFIKIQLVYDAFEMLQVQERIPFLFISKICDEQNFVNSDMKFEKFGIEVVIIKKFLFIKKIKNMATTYGFFDIINRDCVCKYDFGTLFVKVSKSKKSYANLKFVTNDDKIYFLNDITVPFCFRSRQIDDFVLTKDKKNKSVSDVLSDFGICSKDKNLIPIIESLEQKKIIVVWGKVLGYKDWIV